MGKNVFATAILDTAFLESVYENDRDTALVIFQQYLHDLPADLHSLQESFDSGDKEHFRSLIHKKKVVFSYVGLTAITAELNELESRCATTPDVKLFSDELESILKRINSSTQAVQDVFMRLQQEQSI